jgi:hypothetical protein
MRRAKGVVVMSHRKARSIHAVVIAAATLVVCAGGVAWAQCTGDCNGDLAVRASDIARIIQTILRCGPCAGAIPGGVATGCGGFLGGCPAADFNPTDNCLRAGELAKIKDNVLRTPALQTPGACASGPSATPTLAASPTPTPTATSAVTPRLCGNGIVDAGAGEDCDDGGTCIGGTNANTHCTSEADCMGSGVCEGGINIERVCDVDADCPGSSCIHCKTMGGDGCAANCTFETTLNTSLVPGSPANSPAPGTSSAVVRTDGAITTLPLALSGSLVQVYGKERNGMIPFVQPANGLKYSAIKVGTVACACVRAAAFKSCGGTIFNKDGSLTTNCTPLYTKGDSECIGQKPCTFVHGPGNSATGIVGCNGLDAANLFFAQDAGQPPGGTPTPYPPAPTPPPGAGQPIITLGNDCECTNDAGCGTGQTCNLSGAAKGRCSCLADADCPQAPQIGIGVCPRNCAGSPFGAIKCTSDADCGGGTCPVGACIPSVCATGLACPTGQSCTTGGPGSTLTLSSTAIGTVQPPQFAKPNICNVTLGPTPSVATAGYGADKIYCYNCAGGTNKGKPCGTDADCPGSFCSDDDPEGCVGGSNAGQPCSTDLDCPGGTCVNARGSIQTLPVVSGTATGLITNAFFQGGNTIKSLGPFSVVGAKTDCALLTAPTPSSSGAATAGVFGQLNQPQLADSVVTNLLVTQ